MILERFAPAKINLCLHVLGRRADGYHDLAMLMLPLSLGDRVRLSLSATPGVRVACPGLELAPGEDNIAARAARALLARMEAPPGVDILIDKATPVAAGLGGGSSDAAAVLAGLNQLCGLGLSRAELMEVGVRLGADVPFFLLGGPAWAEGIGDRLTPVPNLPAAWYVLVNPGFPVSTAWVYGNLGLTSPRAATRIPKFSGHIGELTALLHNDLEAVTQRRYPEIALLKEHLLERGALGALMSGSGPTVFGIFPTEEAAGAAARDLQTRPGWRVMVAEPLVGAA